MNNPVLWLCLSFVLVSVSLTAVFVVLVPAVVELSRAARSFEKLCNTLDRDLPPTLESLRETTTEIARLTDDVNAGVQNAGRVAQQVDQSVNTVRNQAQRAQVNTRSLMAGLGAAWTTFNQSAAPRDRPHPVQTTNPQPVASPPSAPKQSPSAVNLPTNASVEPKEIEPRETATAETEDLNVGNERDRTHTTTPRDRPTASDSPSQTTSD